MKLSEIKPLLKTIETVTFILPNGQFVPTHFHVTEVGMITKNFIDCGGTVREEKVVNFQLWEANDFDHRLAPQKLKNIIELSEKILNLQDAEIEVEYQQDTVGKYNLDFDGNHFLLLSKQTNCLAQDKCGIPSEKLKVNLADLNNQSTTCTPGGGCC
ncbi:MAG: hypothetical protein HYR91_10335 [Flavobacteriia bacterium]|nr:hypothetical protein [Flavobacteriia bacterium]